MRFELRFLTMDACGFTKREFVKTFENSFVFPPPRSHFRIHIIGRFNICPLFAYCIGRLNFSFPTLWLGIKKVFT